MTKDEMQKMLEFVAQRQEQFADNMQQAEARMNRFESAFVGLFALTNENAKAIKELREAQAQADERAKQADERAKQTDERLNVLINVVERFISAKSNGDKPDSEKQ
jgi:hypothetical protein